MKGQLQVDKMRVRVTFCVFEDKSKCVSAPGSKIPRSNITYKYLYYIII